MNVRQIEAFQAVMATGSVTRAGERLSISQPAVSQLIAQLERSCGFPLFHRQGGKITPTREAEALYNEVQRMFIGVGQIARVATALREQNWGSVSLAAFPAITRRVLPDIVWSFCKAHPDTRFRLESMRSRSLIDAVAAQHVDFGLSILPGDRPEVVSALLHRLRGVCILPAGHHLADQPTIYARDLADEDFVSLGPQDHSRYMIDRVFDELKVSRRSRIEAGQSETAFSFVAARAGVAVVDPISAFNNEDPRIVVRRFEPAVQFDIWLIRPKAARTFNLVDNFVAYTLERLDRFAASLNGG
ncbi:LysR substrate-binding domain-containing protein [Azospirillum rugosum]|uniref:DNA-binding transcriptional LysR family regulator n=1 Tax=Azospirillum rugosum TaxID=416170 RepID=A0ABS4SW64_9PROT|nr:LysR substrate-binding domain-containing protein [Azospirillum rugosum]MBP2296801.1 DNA-binding transcriptional LysR family regulator [Azospirillum rugosum]MDQ0530404.1 DNA-binding transcriptional LysR family regulator [Azospirillum rugosum]